MAVVDVRDAALAHRLAFEKPEAANERFLVFSSQWIAQDWCMYHFSLFYGRSYLSI